MTADQQQVALIELGGSLLAMPTASILKLLLVEEVLFGGGPIAEDADLDPSGRTLVSAGARLASAWDLGLLFERGRQYGGWCLVEVEHGRRRLPIALRIDRCLGVRSVGAVTPLPRPMFRGRGAAITGVVPAGSDRAALAVDLQSLWHPAELSDIARCLDTAARPAESASS